MSGPELLRLFATLPLPSGLNPAGRFSAQPIPGIDSCSVGKDTAGCPVLLIETAASGPRAPVAPITLQNISVLHNIDCRLLDAAGAATVRRFSVIRCCDDDTLMHEYFLRCLTPIMASLPGRPRREQVVDAVNALIELFRRVQQPARKTVQGLWAELFVIQRASDPAVLIRGWHAAPEDRFDFAEDDQRLEVKTASGRVRMHHFSHEQLRPPTGVVAMIASLLIERSTGGHSVNDLIDDIRERVADPGLLLRVHEIVAATLGNEWRATQGERFDRQLAAESLRFFDSRTIPSVPIGLPPEISDVHFRVDLSNHSAELSDEIRQTGRLFGASFSD